MKVILSIATATLLLSASAQNNLPSKKVTIYKNGTALIVNEGTASTKNGNVLLPLPEKALYGAYWVGAAKENGIRNLTFKIDTLKKNIRCETVQDYVAANVGKQATIYFTASNQIDKSLSGTIADFNQQTNMVKVKTEKGNSWLKANSIYQVEFKESESNTFLADSLKRMIVLQPEKTASTIALQEFYLQSGMNWIPSYFLKLKDSKNARLEMKATIENGGEAINNAEMELVVGSPQLAFGLKADPMTYDYLTNEGAAALMARNTNNAQYMYKSVQMEAAAGDDMFSQNFDTEGEKTGDLYFYKIGKVSLAKSSKGNFPIFAKELEYKDKYECTIPDYVNFLYSRFANTEENKYDVFHSLEIKNTSGVPLTSAPIMVLNEKEQFLAQDNMGYTPAGANTDVRLSKAIDIVTKSVEEELSRNESFKKLGKTTYAKATLKGTITIENFQAVATTVNITKNLTGEVNKQSDGAAVTKKKSYHTSINPESQIKWEVPLKANEKKTISYEYDVLYGI